MVIRNRLLDAPDETEKLRRWGKGYDVEFWARYFPTAGIEYHVNVRNISPNCEILVLIQCKLIGGIDTQHKENLATQAEILISRHGVDFGRVPTIARNVGLATCGLEQITAIRSITLTCEGLRRVD
ncbi:MAG: hypothetical protein COB08_018705 [Rhodobacteraceae bacterium]|nr:hypothetical protein [Paracoccaceae bacterium]